MDLTEVLRTVRGTPTGLVEMEKWRMSIMSMEEGSVEVEKEEEEESWEGIRDLLQRRTRRIEFTEVVCADRGGKRC